MFQSTVQINMGLGVPGELFTDQPYIVTPYTINTTGFPQYNIIGATYCTQTGQGQCMAGGTGPAAGFLVTPKDQASYGAGGVPLSPTLTVNNYSIVSCATMGQIIVTLPNTANPGDNVIYNTSTGVISSIAPSATVPVGSAFAFAQVQNYVVSAPGLAVITISNTLVIPA